MSTKLYNAYKLPEMDLVSFFNLVEKVRKKINAIQMETYNKEFSQKCLKIYDFKTLYPDKNVIFNYGNYQDTESEMTIHRIVSKLMEMEHKAHEKNNQMNSFYFHAHFLHHNGRIYSVLRCLNQEMEKAFVKISKAELYEYYNNTDCPEGISEKDWKLREKEWDKVFGDKIWDVANSKNSIKLHCDFQIWNKDFKENLPLQETVDFKKRTNSFSTDEVVREHFLNKTYNEYDVIRFLGSDEFKEKILERNNEMLKKLKHSCSDILLDTSVIKRTSVC